MSILCNYIFSSFALDYRKNEFKSIRTFKRKCQKSQKYCYKLIQRFRVIGLFAGQFITKLHGTITGVIYTIVGSALLKD